MDYEEKYKMALEGIQEILSSGQDSIKMSRLQLRLQGIFPELKTRKSENDTMIEVVKNIIARTDNVSLDEILIIYGKSKDDIISWLEKQDKTANNADKIEPKFKVGDIISNGKIVYSVEGITKNRLGQNCYSLVDVESEKKGILYLTMYDSKGETYRMGETSWLCEQVDAKFEKQGEQKTVYITDEWIENYWNHEKVINPYSYDKGEEIQFGHQGFVNFCKEYGKKTIDKIEPKFKVGDWIIRSAEGFKHDTYLVTDVKDYYVCEDLSGERVTFTFNEVHKHFTLWEIQDAKKGDVLYSLDSCRPFIYKDRRPHEQASAYCGINVYGKFFVWNTKDCIIVTDEFVPSTKEQRDTLFAKMKEAGFEWDSDKKQLKPIKKNYTNKENEL